MAGNRIEWNKLVSFSCFTFISVDLVEYSIDGHCAWRKRFSKLPSLFSSPPLSASQPLCLVFPCFFLENLIVPEDHFLVVMISWTGTVVHWYCQYNDPSLQANGSSTSATLSLCAIYVLPPSRDNVNLTFRGNISVVSNYAFTSALSF